MDWNGDEVARRFAQQAVDANIHTVEERARDGVAALRCPAHQQCPSVLCVTRVGNRLVVHVSACCEDMKIKAERVAAGVQ